MDCESHDKSRYADARRALLRTMREVRTVSECIGTLVTPCLALAPKARPYRTESME